MGDMLAKELYNNLKLWRLTEATHSVYNNLSKCYNGTLFVLWCHLLNKKNDQGLTNWSGSLQPLEKTPVKNYSQMPLSIFLVVFFNLGVCHMAII